MNWAMEWFPTSYLANGWLAVMAFFLLFYAVTDGADLGVGMISLFLKKEEERGLLMEILTYTWHSNQTWLVIVGGMLFGAFPLFYAIVFTGLYIPLMALLFSLILRGVALDLYEDAEKKGRYGALFGVGSILTTICEGFALGGLLHGITVEEGRFAGGIWDWFTPFSGIATAGVLAGFITLGASLIILKTEGNLRERAYRIGFWAGLATALLSIGAWIWIFYINPHVVNRWTSSAVYFIAPFPGAAAICFLLYLYSLRKRRVSLPMFLNGLIVIFSFGGVALSFYPQMIPTVIGGPLAITRIAAPRASLTIMSVFIVVMMPIILIYYSYEFFVFRGVFKEKKDEIEQEKDLHLF